MVERAAVKCSERIMSTVALKGGTALSAGVMQSAPNAEGESDLGEDLLRGLGLRVPDMNLAKGSLGDTGVMKPGVSDVLVERCNACDAACKSRFVVPNDFVEPERAEHTMTTLCWSRYSLRETQ